GAVGRVLTHLEGHPELLGPLGIPRALALLVTRPRAAEPWSFLSRFDWARTLDGRWKLLEINSDTPAGLGDAEASHRAGGPSRIARGPGPAPRARPGGARGLAQHVHRHGYSGRHPDRQERR